MKWWWWWWSWILIKHNSFLFRLQIPSFMINWCRIYHCSLIVKLFFKNKCSITANQTVYQQEFHVNVGRSEHVIWMWSGTAYSGRTQGTMNVCMTVTTKINHMTFHGPSNCWVLFKAYYKKQKSNWFLNSWSFLRKQLEHVSEDKGRILYLILSDKAHFHFDAFTNKCNCWVFII